MSTTKLTQQQLNFLHTFGYLQLPGLMRDRIDRITEEFEALFARNGAYDGKAHDGTRRSSLMPFIGRSEYLSSLLDDPRIDDMISSILGEDYNFLMSDGHYFIGHTFWHSDGDWPRWVAPSYKLSFYLDPTTRETGALRVIPGSHHYGDVYTETLQKGAGAKAEAARRVAASDLMNPYWGVPDDQLPCVVIETQPGDVLIFHHSLKHSSWGGSNRRRILALNFCPHCTEEQIPLLRQEIGNSLPKVWADSCYGEAMLRTAGPKRRVHLEQILANQDHLPELSRQARERAMAAARM